MGMDTYLLSCPKLLHTTTVVADAVVQAKWGPESNKYLAEEQK